MTLDTGDIVMHDALVRMVCCSHDGYVRLAGHPDVPVHESKLHLVKAATDDERVAQLRVLAASTGTGHRPACARERLAAMMVSYDSGCC